MCVHLSQSKCSKCPPLARNTHTDRQEAPCTGTECSKSWSVTRPFKETAEKILGQWCRLYVVYGRENINSSQTPKSPEWSPECVKKRLHQSKKRDCTRASATHTLDFQEVADGIRQCVKVWGTCSWYSSIMQWRSMMHTTVVCYVLLTQQLLCRAGDLSRLLHLAVRQYSSAPTTEHATQSNFLNGRHPHSLRKPVAPTVQILTQWTKTYGAKCSSGSTRPRPGR